MINGPICGYHREEFTKQTIAVSHLSQWESARKILLSSVNSHKYNMLGCVFMPVKKIICLKLIRDSQKDTAALSHLACLKQQYHFQIVQFVVEMHSFPSF